MKKLLIVLIIIPLFSGCLTTYESAGIVDGLNRGMTQGLLLNDPDYSYLNIIEQQNRQREIQELNRQLQGINNELQMQNHILRWQDPIFFKDSYRTNNNMNSLLNLGY